MGYLFAAFYFALAGLTVFSIYFIAPTRMQEEIREYISNI